MSRLLHEIHTRCYCVHFNWRTGITTISIITETIQLAITYMCILILKCLRTHISNIIIGMGDDQEERALSSEVINELKVFYSIIIIYALVIFIFGIICSVLLISGAKKCHSVAVLSWLIYQGLFSASSFVIAYILIKVRDDKKYVYSSMKHKTFYDLSTGIYWVTFITFLPVLLYFCKRVLSIYMQMIKDDVQASCEEENSIFLININNNINAGQLSSDDEAAEHQSVACVADPFVKNVTLDMEY